MPKQDNQSTGQPNRQQPEHELDKANMLLATQYGARLFRNNVAMGWVGQSERVSHPATLTIYPGDVVIRRARPLHTGLCEGSSDLIGWTSTGRFLAVEDKSPFGKLRPAQRLFLDAVAASGGLAILARSKDDLRAGLSNADFKG